MIFSSLQYLLFLPLVVVLYWRTRGSTRLWVLLLASYFFYMSWMPVYGLLLFGLTLINWLIGCWMEKLEQPAEKRLLSRKVVFWLGIAINLGCLFYYKYTNFFLETLAQLYNSTCASLKLMLPTAQVPQPWQAPVFELVLPLAISFFVFEFVHYLADVYKGSKPVKSLMEFSVFSAFFPSQIAGPIKRYQDFQEKLANPEPWGTPLFLEGATLFMQGLFKKVAIADPLASLIYTYFHTSHAVSGADAWLAALGFVIQVYCDFSGYTDMGRGSALFMGVRLPENFTLPFLAVDINEFWRRWHMSLSTWLRDYVYFPLGGSKSSRVGIWRNLLLTMVVCGLWHGASWHYVIFGITQGVGMIVNREYRLWLDKADAIRRFVDTKPMKCFSVCFTFLFITVTYSIFRSPDMAHSFNLLGSLFNSGECTMWEPLMWSGVVAMMGLYVSCWMLTAFLESHPTFLPGLRPAGTGYIYPVKLASWTVAIILLTAARPVVAIPFVYFQF